MVDKDQTTVDNNKVGIDQLSIAKPRAPRESAFPTSIELLLAITDASPLDMTCENAEMGTIKFHQSDHS